MVYHHNNCFIEMAELWNRIEKLIKVTYPIMILRAEEI